MEEARFGDAIEARMVLIYTLRGEPLVGNPSIGQSARRMETCSINSLVVAQYRGRHTPMWSCITFELH